MDRAPYPTQADAITISKDELNGWIEKAKIEGPLRTPKSKLKNIWALSQARKQNVSSG